MVWLWIGVGAVACLVALALLVWVLDIMDRRALAKKSDINRREYEAEAAMVRTVQNTIAEMFDAVRRQR